MKPSDKPFQCFMIERRFGPGNCDWLMMPTPNEIVWTCCVRQALLFPSLTAAGGVLRDVRVEAVAWDNAVQFRFAIIHDRRALPQYWRSIDAAAVPPPLPP